MPDNFILQQNPHIWNAVDGRWEVGEPGNYGYNIPLPEPAPMAPIPWPVPEAMWIGDDEEQPVEEQLADDRGPVTEAGWAKVLQEAEDPAIYQLLKQRYNEWSRQRIRGQILNANQILNNIAEDDMEKGIKLKNYSQDHLCHRRCNLSAFKPPYDDINEIQLRLHNSVSNFNGIPLLVTGIKSSRGDFRLSLRDDEETYIEYYSRIKDIRTPEPGYLSYDNGVYFFTRKPSNGAQGGDREGRDYSQGITSVNAKLQPVAKKRLLDYVDLPELVKGFKYRKDQVWSSSIQEMLHRRILSTIRLSNTIAVAIDPKKKALAVLYRNRPLGTLKDNRVTVTDPDDMKPWIISDLRSSNLSVNAA